MFNFNFNQRLKKQLIMNTRILLLMAFCINFSLSAQIDFQANYKPLDCSFPKNNENIIKITEQYEGQIEALAYKNKSDYKAIYENRYNQLTDRFENDHFVFDYEFNAYFTYVLRKILTANPDLPGNEIRVLVSRSPIPNASSWGEGTITLNIGLLRRLENESQVAFVLAHELVHYFNNHSGQAITNYVETLNSRETKKAVRKIKRSEYNRGEKLEALVKNVLYDKSRHSRYNESEADSTALTYLKKTDYDISESINCMKILDTIDEEKFDLDLDYKVILNSKTYPFKKKWLKEEVLITFGKTGEEDKVWNEDSLKTHPDCSKRIVSLERQIKKVASGKTAKFLQAETKFSEIITRCDFEMVEQAYTYGNLSRSIYYSLQLLEKYPENTYLNTILARSFQRIYEVRTDHEAFNYIDLPSNYYKEDYKELLNILQNMRSKEVLKLSYHLLENNKSKFIQDEYFLYVLICSNYLNKKDETFKILKKRYLNTFPDGKHKYRIHSFVLDTSTD